MKYLSIIFLLVLNCLDVSSQVTIEGRLLQQNGDGIPRINVLVYLPGSETLITFAISDQHGVYKTNVSSPSDSLQIEISSIQFRNEVRMIENKSQNLDFELTPEQKELKGVIVKVKPIEQRGDTLSFLVSSFARLEDRSIEDVLRRMPGIEVESSGKIFYQGMPLNKFYVEGLDLMDGSYGVISKNLPKDAVSTVEIMENHQPVKILEDKVSSMQAALNVKLKSKVAVVGTAKTGAGLSPLLWDINLSPMLFTKKIQVLASYQTNNTGNDVAQQLEVFTIQDLMNNSDRPVDRSQLISIQDIAPPQIEEHRYLDNNIHLLNFNVLLPLNNDFQLRTNLHYINDLQHRKVELKRTIYNIDDTLHFTERFDNMANINYFTSKFNLNRNVKNNYFDNELKIKARWNKLSGLVYPENLPVSQTLSNPLKSISNELRTVYPIADYLIEINSYISFDQNPHELQVEPGQFEEALNNGNPYDKAIQQTNLHRFYTNNSAGFVFGLKNLSISPLIGVSYRHQNLNSNIQIVHNGNYFEADTSFKNNLDGSHTHAYMQAKVEYKKQRLSISAKLPLSWQNVFMEDTDANRGQEVSRIYFDPGLSAEYRLGNFWRARASWRYSNTLGDIERIHYRFIMSSYRNLNQNSAPISETSRHNISTRISYRNSIISFFNTVGYAFSKGLTNITQSNIINADGSTIRHAVEIPQTTNVHSFHASSSKYISGLKTSLGVKVYFTQRQGKSLMNGELFDTKNVFFNFVPNLNFRVTTWLNMDYSLDASYIRTYIENEQKNQVSMLRHKFDAFAFPVKNQTISLSSEYYDYDGTKNLFIDLLYRYTFTKKKIDVELRWNNIFNNKTYTSFQARNFMVWESTYVLRPSQLLMLVNFSF